MTGFIKVDNYINGMENLPLKEQLERVKKQLQVFLALDKRPDLTEKGRAGLVASWHNVINLKIKLETKIIASEAVFYIN